MTNDNIKTEISDRKAIMDANATLGVQKIQTIIKEGKEHNALQASIFSVEQVEGKAKQSTEVISKHTFVTYDLSGGQAGEIPQEVLDQLEA